MVRIHKYPIIESICVAVMVVCVNTTTSALCPFNAIVSISVRHFSVVQACATAAWFDHVDQCERSRAIFVDIPSGFANMYVTNAIERIWFLVRWRLYVNDELTP